VSDLREFGRDVLRREAEGVLQLAELLDDVFDATVEKLSTTQGHVVLCGVGKPWLIGQKISATLASTGTPSFCLHPSEAMHGDFGRLRSGDVVIVLSNSGASEEISRVLPVLGRLGAQIVAVTSDPESNLARGADLVLNIGKVAEACPIGMAPSVSTTVMLALGDALALAVMKSRNFTRQDYARFHPGGALGRSMMQVAEVMQPLAQTAWVESDATVADALNCITLQKAGAAWVLEHGVLAGVFTDGDLRRHIGQDNLLSQPITEVMTRGCRSVELDVPASQAVSIIQNHRIGELPVVDSDNVLKGQVTLKDLVTMQFL